MEKELVQELVKQVLPTYEIHEMLGEGSFGAVYRIKDSLKERAVKIIQLNATASIEKGAKTEGKEKIERDFRHIVENYEKIACDEIVTVYDFYKVASSEDRNQATAYAVVVMELYPQNLLDFVMEHFQKNNRLLDIDTVASLMEKLAHLVNNLYVKQGFLFEDLKPENLLVKRTGGELKIVVGDIGGLKSLRSVSATGSQVTLSYCAAEVIRSRQKPDLRSTIYAFGLISYFMLEGHLPYEEAGVSERIDLVREEGLVFDRSDLPSSIKYTIERCLAFDPVDRFQNYEEVISAIEGKTTGADDAFGAGTIDLDSFVAPEQPKSPVRPQRFASPQPWRRPPYTGTQKTGTTAGPLVGMKAGMTQRMFTDTKKKMQTVRISSEYSEAEKIENEISGLVVGPNDLHKIQNQSCRVSGDIRIENGGMLVIENAKLFFEENAGILSSGTLRATNSLFSALDVKKKWANIALNPLDTRLNSFEGCKFRFGGGRKWKSIRASFSLTGYPLNDEYTYGGALFIAEAKQRLVVVSNSTFYTCSAHEGGGLFCLKTQPSLSNCSFENCSAGLSGGGISCFEANPHIVNCKLHTCLAQKEGGGMFCRASNPTVEKCTFENCSTKHLYGGGIYCQESSPIIKDCRFNRCAASKDSGGIYCDDRSRPKILFPSFSNCRPNNTNYNIHGRT